MSAEVVDAAEVVITFMGQRLTGFAEGSFVFVHPPARVPLACAACGAVVGDKPAGSSMEALCNDDCRREFWRTRQHFVEGGEGVLCGSFDLYTGARRYCRLHGGVP